MTRNNYSTIYIGNGKYIHVNNLVDEATLLRSMNTQLKSTKNGNALYIKDGTTKALFAS